MYKSGDGSVNVSRGVRGPLMIDTGRVNGPAYIETTKDALPTFIESAFEARWFICMIMLLPIHQRIQ